MISVVLARSPQPRMVEELPLQLPDGATIAEALAMVGWALSVDGSEDSMWTCGVWGRQANPDTPLRAGDRVELYRSLRVDPKVARRERFVGQGSRNAGLFAQRRPNSKAGY
ncbi:RnfH family protein [Hydrogenophaga flava]|uniref:RnfH family protein n=1 Tax=Hydrogenophaga flava TaxID=65657 RepID=UPI00082506E8|nr:RnfH family protein [Hydrogenophaga flava]